MTRYSPTSSDPLILDGTKTNIESVLIENIYVSAVDNYGYDSSLFDTGKVKMFSCQNSTFTSINQKAYVYDTRT